MLLVWSKIKNNLQDDTAKTNTDATSSQPQVEKRSKKKHEVNASTLTAQA
jgi:hypothetical protein